jgi:hypothetical protein
VGEEENCQNRRFSGLIRLKDFISYVLSISAGDVHEKCEPEISRKPSSVGLCDKRNFRLVFVGSFLWFVSLDKQRNEQKK